jgi:hypothetical protein
LCFEVECKPSYTLSNSQEKWKGANWSFEMGLKQTHKCAFKVRWTCTIQEQRQLMQIETKMLHGLNHKRNTFTCSPWPNLGGNHHSSPDIIIQK